MFDSMIRHTLVPLILRLCLAAVFIYHGMHMISGENNKLGAAWNKNSPDMPAAEQLAVAWGELACGLGMLFGFLTRLAAVGIIILMVGAIYTIHWPNGFSIIKGGYEYNIALIAMSLVLLLIGGGSLAVDRVFRLRRRPVVVQKPL